MKNKHTMGKPGVSVQGFLKEHSEYMIGFEWVTFGSSLGSTDLD